MMDQTEQVYYVSIQTRQMCMHSMGIWYFIGLTNCLRTGWTCVRVASGGVRLERLNGLFCLCGWDGKGEGKSVAVEINHRIN